MAPDVAGHGRTGSIAVEQVAQRFPLPLEEREFIAIQDVSSDIKGSGSQAASALIGGSVDFSANAIDHAIKAAMRMRAMAPSILTVR